MVGRRDLAAHERCGIGFLFGIGIGVTVASDWHCGIWHRIFAVDGASLGIANGCGTTMNSMTLGVQYRFGRRKQTL